MSEQSEILAKFLEYDRKETWVQIESAILSKECYQLYKNNVANEVPTWKVCLELPGVNLQDALLYCKFRLGEECFNRGPVGTRSFNEIFDLQPLRRSISRKSSNADPNLRSKAQQIKEDDEDGQTQDELSSSDSDNEQNAVEEEDDLDSDEKDNNSNSNSGEKELDLRKTFAKRFSQFTSSLRRTSLLSGVTSTRPSTKFQHDKPRRRKLYFTRHVFESAVVGLDIDTESDQSVEEQVNFDDDIKRVHLKSLGVHLELFQATASTAKIRFTYIVAIDPMIEGWENTFLSDIDYAHGKYRAEEFARNTYNFFSDPNYSTLVKPMLHYCLEMIGDHEKWTYKNTESLGLGALVRHQTSGKGYVDSYDMRGGFKVKYDNLDSPTIHQFTEEKEKFQVLLGIGSRVKHPKRGLGTLQSSLYDKLHVRFDSHNAVIKYSKNGWAQKLKKVHGNRIFQLSSCAHPKVREGIGRVEFTIPDVTPKKLLKKLFEKNETISSTEKDEVFERRIVKVLDENNRIIWEHRNLPKPLSPRTFLSSEKYSQVSNSYVVYMECCDDLDAPKEEGGSVRGFKISDGWVFLPHSNNSCFVTHTLCVDFSGFVPPETVIAIRDSILIGEALDMLFST